MKKLLLAVVVLAVVAFAAFKIWGGNSNKPAREKQKALSAEMSGAFNESFDKLLTAYFAVKDALVASDTAKASAAAKELANAADNLKLEEIQGDSTGAIKLTAKDYAGTISGSAMALAGEKDLAGKRTEFKMIAESVWTIFRTVKYKGKKLYWQYCPMAFNDQGAYWVSQENIIRNPYFGSEMLECGTVEDSLDYSNK